MSAVAMVVEIEDSQTALAHKEEERRKERKKKRNLAKVRACMN